jgi:hypothetical protein
MKCDRVEYHLTVVSSVILTAGFFWDLQYLVEGISHEIIRLLPGL